MHLRKRYALFALVLGATTLLAVPHALGGQSRVIGHCHAASIDESSETADVIHIGDGIDAAARASQLALRSRSSVTTDEAQDMCNALSTFSTTLQVGAGTTGLPLGAPVKLAVTVTLGGELSTTVQGPPQTTFGDYHADAQVDSVVTVTAPDRRSCGPEVCGPTEVGRFGAQAGKHMAVYVPTQPGSLGLLVSNFAWSWYFVDGNGLGPTEQDSVRHECNWMPTLTCGGSDTPPPTPGYEGSHTRVLDAYVGDRLRIDGLLNAMGGAQHGYAAASFPALDAGNGLRVTLAGASGFEGLTITEESSEPDPGEGSALTIGDASVAEGDAGTAQLSFPVHLSPASDGPVDVSYQAYNGTATQPEDYLPARGTLTFAPGETEKTVVVDVKGDEVAEADETLQVLLSAPPGLVVADGSGEGTILDDDGSVDRPTLTVEGSSVLEGTEGTVQAGITVKLSAPAKANVTFDWATEDGTAKQPGDYTSASGHVLIRVGETGATMLVPVGDTEPEPSETVDVVLSNVQGATVGGEGRGTLRIDDDDAGCTPTLVFDYVEAKGCFTPTNGSYVAAGTVRVNGLELVPNRGAEVLVDPAHHRLYSRSGDVGVRVGGDVIWKGTIDWHTPILGAKPKVKVTDLETSFLDGRTVRGLPIVTWQTIEFDSDHRAFVTIPLLIPFVKVVVDGVGLTGEAVLVTDNSRGLHSDSIKVTADPIVVPPITIRKLAISWDELRQRWEGSGTLVLPTPEALSVSAGVAFQNGRFAGASGGVENLNVPIGGGVYLQAIRFSLDFEPLRVGGGIGISAGPVIAGKTAFSIDGQFSIDFDDPLTIEASGTARVVGFPLAAAWFRYLATGTVQFGGQIAIGLPDPSSPGKQPVHVVASLGGWVNGSVGFAARGSADVAFFGVPLVGADLLVSNIGAAACGHIAWLKAGFGYRWDTGAFSVMGGNCDVGAYSPPVPVGTRALAAGAVPTSFTLPKSAEGVVLRLRGAAGTPTVTLTGPGGRSVTTPAAGAPLVNDEFVVLQDEVSNTTIVAIRHPAGTWTMTPEAGSEVTSVEHASIGADPSVDARVTGTASAPRLSWKTQAKPGRTVTFVEQAEDVAHVIVQTADAKGSVAFTPAGGPAGRRDIVAIVEQDGLPRLSTVVARYDAPDPDDDLPGDRPARKQLGKLKRSVVSAHLAHDLERQLVGSLRAARRALRPPTPDVATACARVGDFVAEVEQATGPGRIDTAHATAWVEAARAVQRLLGC